MWERYCAIWMLLSHLGQGDLDLSCAAHSQHPALLGDCHPIPLPAAERTSHETISFSPIFSVLTLGSSVSTKSKVWREHWQPNSCYSQSLDFRQLLVFLSLFTVRVLVVEFVQQQRDHGAQQHERFRSGRPVDGNPSGRWSSSLCIGFTPLEIDPSGTLF